MFGPSGVIMNKTMCTLLMISCTVIALLLVHIYLLDGLDGWFFSSKFLGEGFPDDTVYSRYYSDRGPAHDDSYRVRVIHFDHQKVVRKISEFYLD
jgi:hypothetical protein